MLSHFARGPAIGTWRGARSMCRHESPGTHVALVAGVLSQIPHGGTWLDVLNSGLGAVRIRHAQRCHPPPRRRRSTTHVATTRGSRISSLDHFVPLLRQWTHDPASDMRNIPVCGEPVPRPQWTCSAPRGRPVVRYHDLTGKLHAKTRSDAQRRTPGGSTAYPQSDGNGPKRNSCAPQEQGGVAEGCVQRNHFDASSALTEAVACGYHRVVTQRSRMSTL